MKRYLIFAAVGPFIGGFLLLLATTVASGYWDETNWGEVGKFFATFVKTLPFSYLFGIVPGLMIGFGLAGFLAHTICARVLLLVQLIDHPDRK